MIKAPKFVGTFTRSLLLILEGVPKISYHRKAAILENGGHKVNKPLVLIYEESIHPNENYVLIKVGELIEFFKMRHSGNC